MAQGVGKNKFNFPNFVKCYLANVVIRICQWPCIWRICAPIVMHLSLFPGVTMSWRWAGSEHGKRGSLPDSSWPQATSFRRWSESWKNEPARPRPRLGPLPRRKFRLAGSASPGKRCVTTGSVFPGSARTGAEHGCSPLLRARDWRSGRLDDDVGQFPVADVHAQGRMRQLGWISLRRKMLWKSLS